MKKKKVVFQNSPIKTKSFTIKVSDSVPCVVLPFLCQ